MTLAHKIIAIMDDYQQLRKRKKFASMTFGDYARAINLASAMCDNDDRARWEQHIKRMGRHERYVG